MSDFLENEMTAKVFSRTFFYVFLRDDNLDPSSYHYLNELFFILEDYVEDPSLRNGNDITEESLQKAAKKALKKLSEIHKAG